MNASHLVAWTSAHIIQYSREIVASYSFTDLLPMATYFHLDNARRFPKNYVKLVSILVCRCLMFSYWSLPLNEKIPNHTETAENASNNNL